VIFDKYVTNLTSTTLALKSELDELKQELVREKCEKFKLERAYENAKEGWIAQNQEVQNLHQVIARVSKLFWIRRMDCSKLRGAKSSPSYCQEKCTN